MWSETCRENLTHVARTAIERSEHRHLHGRTRPHRRRPYPRSRGRCARPQAQTQPRSGRRSLQALRLAPRLHARQQYAASRCHHSAPRSFPIANGTAPGQFIEGAQDGSPRYVFLLPGPPHELKPCGMSSATRSCATACPAPSSQPASCASPASVNPRSTPASPRSTPSTKTWRPRSSPSPAKCNCISRPRTHHAGSPGRVDQLAGEIEDELDDAVFSTNGETLEQIVGYYLQMRSPPSASRKAAPADLMAERLTNVSGSSRYFVGGVVVYSNDLKTLLADVPPTDDRRTRRGQPPGRRRAWQKTSATPATPPSASGSPASPVRTAAPKTSLSASSTSPSPTNSAPMSSNAASPATANASAGGPASSR